jgi:hypothetical protein
MLVIHEKFKYLITGFDSCEYEYLNIEELTHPYYIAYDDEGDVVAKVSYEGKNNFILLDDPDDEDFKALKIFDKFEVCGRAEDDIVPLKPHPYCYTDLICGYITTNLSFFENVLKEKYQKFSKEQEKIQNHKEKLEAIWKKLANF